MKMKSIVWFYRDLRINDNPTLKHAADLGDIIPIFIFDDKTPKHCVLGQASKWWLHHSLISLDKSLENKLNFYEGSALDIIKRLVKTFSPHAFFWSQSYEPWHVELSITLKKFFAKNGILAKTFNTSYLQTPDDIKKDDDTPYKVFTPFYKKILNFHDQDMPAGKTSHLSCIKDPNSQSIQSLNLLPQIPWYKTMEKTWDIGEKAAQKRLQQFIDDGLCGYSEGRNFPAQKNISCLSPYLHFGELSPNRIWHAICNLDKKEIHQKDSDAFLRELIWREFSMYLLFHFPQFTHKNFQKKFDNFAWGFNKKLFRSWCLGKTGYPLVDAGMRELWQTGFMHNRVRMVVASFLVKNLLVDWRKGAAWFLDTLVDADAASNSMNWQWVAGCGVDAAPYFRIFNPTTQGEKFDKEGVYTKRFVPELEHLPAKYLYKPWLAPKQILEQAGVVLGQTYPHPIVDLNFSRERALDAYRHL